MKYSILMLDNDKSRWVDCCANNPDADITLTDTPSEFVHLATNGQYDALLLDHDLSVNDTFPNGRVVTRHLRNNQCQRLSDMLIIIHSLNQNAAAQMIGDLANYYNRAMYIPGVWTFKNIFNVLI